MSEFAYTIDSLQLPLALAANGGQQAIEISFIHLLLAFLVIATESVVARLLEIGMSDQLLVAGIRAFVQLNILGYILAPIFASNSPCFVLLYIFGFMVLVSSYEAAARPKVTYPGLFFDAVKTTAVSLFATGILMVIIVRPKPWYKAQYLIPIAGMLISNSLTGNALALNGILEHLTSRKEQVEVLLAFGANKWEACWPGFANIFRTALIPAINGLNTIGLVSIPGMMTGQILGGSSPEKAARYQIVITFLISGSNFISVALIMTLAIRSLFDDRGRLKTKEITKQERLKVAQLFSPSEWKKRRAARLAQKANVGKTESLLEQSKEPCVDLELRAAKPYAGSAPVVFDVNLNATIAQARPVTVRLQVHAKETTVIMGPSGIGKSTILKMVCDLEDQGNGTLSLLGQDLKASTAMDWRRDVLYVHQARAPLPDSPKDLIVSIDNLKIYANVSEKLLGSEALIELLNAFGLSELHLERPWSGLSGGEAQRVMIAICLATKPRMILLDEPTSALDEETKRSVEDAVARCDCSVIWVTHDEQQAQRIGDSIWKLASR